MRCRVIYQTLQNVTRYVDDRFGMWEPPKHKSAIIQRLREQFQMFIDEIILFNKRENVWIISAQQCEAG